MRATLIAGAITQVNPADGWQRRVLNSLPLAEFLKALVNVRQMVRCHVVNECGRDLVIADAPVEPTQENRKVRDRGEHKSKPIRTER